MSFERGRDVKDVLELGIKEDKGYNITNILKENNENMILPGIVPNEIYKITHSGSRSVSGFCSGKKFMKVLLSLTKKGYAGYIYKWIWDPTGDENGGSLYFYYSSDGDFWVDSNNTMGYNFSKMGDGSILEL